MSGVIINPGSGPVGDLGHPSLANAWENIRVFRRDLTDAWKDVQIERVPRRARREEREDGRYGFVLSLSVPNRKRPLRCEVWMPGLPLKRVRWFDEKDGDIWDFPRLYVGRYGTSWIWTYALNDVADELRLED